MPRVLVIGLDGATLDLVEPWVKEGKLPEIAKLIKNGCYGSLNSVYPVLSSAAWASFMTGLNPGKHGVYDFFRRAPDSYHLRLVNRSFIHGQSIWKVLGDNGFKVVVVNVPMTYPTEQVNGVMVTGLGTPNNKPFTFPISLSEGLNQKGYTVNKQLVFKPGNEAAFLKEVYETTDKLSSVALELMEQDDWSFFMVVFRDTDELGHFFWSAMDSSHPGHLPGGKYSGAILEYYQKIDEYIGRFVEKSGEDTTVIIMSDHGHGPLYRDVLLNEWLKQKGYLVVKQGYEYKNIFSHLGVTRNNISSFLRKIHLSKLETWIKDILGNRIELLPKTTRAEFPTSVDWTKTTVYSFGYHGQIYLNLKGREPDGIVDPAEYDELLVKITEDLQKMVDPSDNQPVVDKVLRKNEIFFGPYDALAPDLTVVMRDFSYITRLGYEFGDQIGEIFTAPSTHESGSHRLDGMLLISGPAANKNKNRMNAANLIDLMPTIVHLFGCPVPDNLDGNVLNSWIHTGSQVIFHSVEEDTATSLADVALADDEEAELVDRLKGLGYL